ncbi:MAG TPA: zinc ribbon domain-containing protein [Myxococcota bacterium]|nr:zinc ribbon domain-containing protein [Myxococcota bacterium]
MGRRPGRHLFAGLLACGECGGSFFDLHGTGFLGCGWHRDRGPLACASALRVDVAELEARVLGAICDRILVPDVVAEAVRVPIAELTVALHLEDPDALRHRLGELAAARERLLDLVDAMRPAWTWSPGASSGYALKRPRSVES